AAQRRTPGVDRGSGAGNRTGSLEGGHAGRRSKLEHPNRARGKWCARQRPRPGRRQLTMRTFGRLALVIGVGLALGALHTATATATPTQTPAPTVNPIVAENQLAGTPGWQIPTAGSHLADDTNNQIKGYASAVSVNKGDSLSFAVTVNPVQTFNISFYRMGYYGGIGGRLRP